MRLLVEGNADILARDKLWMTSLHMAANNNQLGCAGVCGVGWACGGGCVGGCVYLVLTSMRTICCPLQHLPYMAVCGGRSMKPYCGHV